MGRSESVEDGSWLSRYVDRLPRAADKPSESHFSSSEKYCEGPLAVLRTEESTLAMCCPAWNSFAALGWVSTWGGVLED
jgi:hypothetical protein